MISTLKGGLIDDGEIIKVSDEFVKQLRTKTPSSKQLVRNLSGGNQQKVVIAKWLEQNSDILILTNQLEELTLVRKVKSTH